CRASAVMQHDGCSQSMSNAAAEAEASVQAIQQLWRTALEEQYAAQADVAYAGDFPDSFDLAPDFLNELIAVGSPRSNDSSLLQRTQTWSSLTHPAQQHSQTPGDDGQQSEPAVVTADAAACVRAVEDSSLYSTPWSLAADMALTALKPAEAASVTDATATGQGRQDGGKSVVPAGADASWR
ncbi:hypothetical protein QJQ45_029937, partial [Haematococcus lacustris]